MQNTDKLTDMIADAIEARMPLSPALEARVQAAVQQTWAEGIRDEDAAATRMMDLTRDDSELNTVIDRQAWAERFTREAIDAGCTYDAERDTWAPPEGMTWDEVFDQMVQRLRDSAGGSGDAP